MVKALLATAAAASLLLGSGVALAQGGNSLTRQDQDFLRHDAHGSAYELQLSQAALQKSTNPQVRQFAQRDVSDHTKLNQEAQQVAQQNGMTLPTTPTEQQQDRIGQLQSMNGRPFDQAYIADMRKLNSEDSSDFDKEKQSTQNPQLKQFVAHAAAMDETHRQLVQTLQTAENGVGSSGMSTTPGAAR